MTGSHLSARPVSRQPRLRAFAGNVAGTTAVEYCVIAAFLSIVALAGIEALGFGVLGLFDDVADVM